MTSLLVTPDMRTRLRHPPTPLLLLTVGGLACATPTEISDPVMTDLAGTWQSDARDLVSLLDPADHHRSEFGYPECPPPDQPPVTGTVLRCQSRPILMTVVPDTATSNLPGVTGDYGICATSWIRSDGDSVPIDVGNVRMEDLDFPVRSTIRLTCAFDPVGGVSGYTFRLTERTLELTHERSLSRPAAEAVDFTVPDTLDAIDVRETLSFSRVR